MPPGVASQIKCLHLNLCLRVPVWENSTLKRLSILKFYFEDFISPPALGQACLQCEGLISFYCLGFELRLSFLLRFEGLLSQKDGLRFKKLL